MANPLRFNWSAVVGAAGELERWARDAARIPPGDKEKHENYARGVCSLLDQITRGIDRGRFPALETTNPDPRKTWPIEPIGFVFQSMHNADMVEGRGPMVPDMTFLNEALAEAYINQQPGCMGRRANWTAEKLGDWQVRVVPVFDAFPTKKELLLASAKAKLTKEELEALGHG